MNRPAPAAAADEPARPDDTEHDYFGTDNYFSRDRFFTDQPPSRKEDKE